MFKRTPLTINNSPLTGKGQVILEFTFCMIIIMLMMYGVAKVFFWTGEDFSERSIAHDAVLVTGIVESYLDISSGPLRQVDPYFYTPIKMDAVWNGD